MGDIQTLRKPSNIPPVTLEELNDYSEGNKDKWINNHKIGDSIRFARDFNPYRIYYLATNLVNYTGREEMIGYIKGGLVFLPFYKRNIVTGGATGKWKDYTTNFDIGGQKKYLFIFDLGPNENAEREAGRNREDEEREARRKREDEERDSRMVQKEIERSLRLMDQMNAQNEAPVRLAEEKRKAESKERVKLNESVNKAPFDSIQDDELGGSRRRTRRRRRSSRKLKQSRRRTRKLRKSRK